ncbi:MAG: sugar-transfer associated ATP-grasp domain-containing protein [Gammaproteobacteria bacterium]
MGQATALDANLAQADWLSVGRPQESSDVTSTLMRMVAASHTSPLWIVSDFARLWRGPGKVSFRDYNRLKLFDREFWADDDRRNVVGQYRSFEIWTKVNGRHDWWGFFENKLASSHYLAAFGFPVIANLAIYCENVTTARSARVLSNKQALRRFLERADHYPLFGKPADGTQSLGSLALRCYRPVDDSVEIFDGRIIRLDDLTAELGKHYTEGYLLQRLMAPHAKLDKNTGEVKRAISGSGVDLAAHSHHPDTGANLIGFRLPHWDAVVAMVIEAARVVEQVPLIGWDIAVLDDGPVIVELNGRPDFTLPQLADSRGILTETPLQEFMTVQKTKEAEWRTARQRERKTW